LGTLKVKLPGGRCLTVVGTEGGAVAGDERTGEV